MYSPLNASSSSSSAQQLMAEAVLLAMRYTPLKKCSLAHHTKMSSGDFGRNAPYCLWAEERTERAHLATSAAHLLLSYIHTPKSSNHKKSCAEWAAHETYNKLDQIIVLFHVSTWQTFILTNLMALAVCKWHIEINFRNWYLVGPYLLRFLYFNECLLLWRLILLHCWYTQNNNN